MQVVNQVENLVRRDILVTGIYSHVTNIWNIVLVFDLATTSSFLFFFFNLNFFFSFQTFHTPSFGDEEFDIPPINPHQQQQQQSHQQDPQNSPNLTYQQLHPQQNMNMNEYQQQQQQQYQHQQYSNQTSYMTQGNQMMMIPQQPQQQQMMMQQQQQGVYIRSPTGNSPPIGHETTTTSEDSDDSTPHPAMVRRTYWFCTEDRAKFCIP